ncbi:hypothetical protein Tco_0947112 [Tanacetum coccineum]
MLVHNQAPEGEGSATLPEPQPTPFTLQPNVSKSQTEPLTTETPPQILHEPQTEAHIEYERVLEQPIEPPLSEGHTSGSEEGMMEHQFELMANVPITPCDSPLLGGYTPRSDEGRLKLQELMTMCTKLSKQVLDLEKEKEKIQTVHTLFMDGTPMEINMLVEKKYPLIKELLEKMLNLQLKAEEESTMAFELIKFIKSLLKE